MADVWSQLAAFSVRIDRYDDALDAYQHYIALKPQEPTAYIGAAAALLKLRKLDEAREQASMAVDVAAKDDRASRAAAHEMLAKIALARRDVETATAEAAAAHEDDPLLPLPAYVDARVLYDQAKYEDALPLFEQASADSKKPGSVQIAELHFYAADTLARLERYPEAEVEFNEELRAFPQNIRARGGLAMLYQATSRPDEAEAALTDMMRIAPTPDSYALAARLFTMFGNRPRAEAVKAEAKHTFADSSRSGSRTGRR